MKPTVSFCTGPLAVQAFNKPSCKRADEDRGREIVSVSVDALRGLGSVSTSPE